VNIFAYQRFCVIASHPDDEILGCGGTLCRLSELGKSVLVIIIGEGPTSRRGNSSSVDKLIDSQTALIKKRLNLVEVVKLRLRDNCFDTYPLLDIIKAVENAASNFKPECVFTQSGSDLNIDHAVTFRAVLTAFRPMPCSATKSVISFEVPSSTEWSFGSLGARFDPNLFVDISDYYGMKKNLLEIYDDEILQYPHPRSYRGVENLARFRGQTVGVVFAEAFQIIWALNVPPRK